MDPAEVEESSGNVFADLELDDPEALLAKSKLVVRLHTAMENRKLTEAAAARRLQIARNDLAVMLRGDLDRFSEAELKRFVRILRQPETKLKSAPKTIM